MSTLWITARDGAQSAIEAREGLSVMAIVRDSGSDEMLALCGGCCSCGTCHVYVDPAFVDRLAPMADDEETLLAESVHRTAGSRLACQLVFSASLDGLRLTVAPED